MKEKIKQTFQCEVCNYNYSEKEKKLKSTLRQFMKEGNHSDADFAANVNHTHHIASVHKTKNIILTTSLLLCDLERRVTFANDRNKIFECVIHNQSFYMKQAHTYLLHDGKNLFELTSVTS